MTRRFILPAFAIALISVTAAPSFAQSSGSPDGADEMSRPYGTQPGDDSRSITVGNRDANGNRVIVNGQAQASAYSSGVGYGGRSLFGSSSAIGNQINVIVQGNWNTVILDAQQINNGNVSANVVLNGGLHLD